MPSDTIFSPVLTTERFILRSLTASDAKDIISFTYFEGTQASTIDDTLTIINAVEQEQKRGNTIHWGIAERETDIVIGGCGYYRGFFNKTGEVGYIVHESYRNKGVMSEVLPVLIRYGFTYLFLEKIKAYTEKDNFPSIALLKKFGFSRVKSDNPRYEKFIIKS